MGEHDVSDPDDPRRLGAFTRELLEDIAALEQMLETGAIGCDVRHIGAEQEMFLVDEHLLPCPRAIEVLEQADEPRLTTELARFNLEGNATPLPFGGTCLRDLEAELRELVGRARAAARACGADVVLTGILPTLRLVDLGIDNLTPAPRYVELNRAMTKQRGGRFHVLVRGIDELETDHDSVMLESCTTSFQVHFQVAPDEFARLYNIAQLITAPTLAAAVNSPLLLGRRLWHETRIALFQAGVDARSAAHQARAQPPRVQFGDRWIDDSALEIFREDIARFRILLTTESGESPLDVVARGDAPELYALRIHNGSVYRWNRPCYGVNAGVPHLRIENRAMPAGPTIVDEVANAALFFGLMAAFAGDGIDVRAAFGFDQAKDNFVAAARRGLDAQLRWLDGKRHAAGELVAEELIPRAREGLLSSGIDPDDVSRYLDVIEARVRSGQTGARWVLRSLGAMGDEMRPDLRARALVSCTLAHQQDGTPGHEWPLAEADTDLERLKSSYKTVGQFMSTDLFTLRADDVIDLAAAVMSWQHVRHVPVEDDEGNLVGLLSHRALVRHFAHSRGPRPDRPVLVRDMMHADPITVTPQTPALEAIDLMRTKRVGCLPVVEGTRLVGILTQRDLIDLAGRLLTDYLGG